MKKISAAAVLILILVILAVSIRCHKAHEIHTTSIFISDVFVQVKAMGTKAAADKAMESAVREIKRIDSRLGYKNSLIDALNRSHILKDREAYLLLLFSLEIHDASSGAFSATLRPILDAWGFTGLHAPRIPSPAEFESWSASEKDASILLKSDGMTIETRAGTQVDIGGTLEGYAADRACEVMKAGGIQAGLIDVGGEVLAFGDREWKVGLKNPRGSGVFSVIPVRNRAVATSGDYERFFTEGTKRYSHILDPATGWPAQGAMSSTVIADSCALANAWAVALFVAGPEKLGSVLEKRGMDWIFVDGEGNIRASRAMRAHCPERIPGGSP